MNYNESKAVPRSDTIATECRLMEFSEIKYYVALIRQIKKPIVVKKAHETYNFNQEKHVVTVCSSNS